MLTKQERQEVAERAKACKKEEELNWDQFSYVLLGIQSWRNDDELLDRIVDLCDTSNMIELPLDKDGEVIRIGDTVYKGFDRYTVTGYVTTSDSTRVTLSAGKYSFDDTVDACYLTHKAPVTVKLLAQQVKNLADSERGYIPSWTFEKLVDIAENLESLGDDNE